MNEKQKPMKTAVVGSGQISEIYLKNMINRFPILDVVGCCSLHGENARKRAEQFRIKAMTYEEILEDKEIELVVNLTPTQAHYQIITDMLNAGKHVYTEKVIAPELAQVQAIKELADKKGLRVGCAPDTFLGAAIQTGAKLIEEGAIGDVTSCNVFLNRFSAFGYQPGRFTTQKGGGIGFDMGIYYLTAVMSLLGPVERVCGFSLPAGECVIGDPRSPQKGQPIRVDNENLMVASLMFRSGVAGTLHFNGRCIYPEAPGITICGTKGILYLPDPNRFGGPVKVLKAWQPKAVRIPQVKKYRDNSRGVGVADMAEAIREGRPHRAAVEMGLHGVEVFCAIEESSRTGRTQEIHSDFVKPERMDR